MAGIHMAYWLPAIPPPLSASPLHYLSSFQFHNSCCLKIKNSFNIAFWVCGSLVVNLSFREFEDLCLGKLFTGFTATWLKSWSSLHWYYPINNDPFCALMFESPWSKWTDTCLYFKILAFMPMNIYCNWFK